MKFTTAKDVKLVVPRRALEVVFEECDRHDTDETGGRILGVYEKDPKVLNIAVKGIIEPGPRAERTGTYLMQDGAHQEQVFREVEAREPSIEHLGNWHTHHVNGMRHLSEGDIQTYRRTVEHKNHNTDFFYALLVTERRRGAVGLKRYLFNNYLLRRGDPTVYEIPAEDVAIVDDALVWPVEPDVGPRAGPSVGELKDHGRTAPRGESEVARLNRVYDREVVSQFYPKVKPFTAGELGLYWRGEIGLVDGSEVEAVVLEDSSCEPPVYKITVRNPPGSLARPAEALGAKEFSSCRAALLISERIFNVELFGRRGGKRGRGKWMF